MIRLKNNTDQINFIGSWLLNNDVLFDDMINFFEKNTHLHNQGATDKGINFNEKKNTDITKNSNDFKKKKIFFIYN